MKLEGSVGGVALVAALLLGSASSMRAQELTWTGSLEFASGDYFFTERTSTFYLMNGLDVQIGSLRLGASLPLVAQDNAIVAQVGGIPLPTGGEQHGELRGRGTGTGSGSGPSADRFPIASSTLAADDPIEIEPGSYELYAADPLLSIGLDFDVAAGPLRALYLGASAKPPLNAEDSGIGTGAWDAGAGAGLTFVAGRLLLLLNATYWSFGDLPELELKDALTYGVGLGSVFGEGPWGWSLSLMGATEIIEGIDPPVSLGGDVLLTSESGRSLRAGLRVGLTEASSDFAASVGWSLPVAGNRRS